MKCEINIIFLRSMDLASLITLINCQNHLEVNPLLDFEWLVYMDISQVHTDLLHGLPKRFHRASGFLFFNHTVSLCISLSEIFSHKEGECRNIYSEVLNSLLFQNAVLALGSSATT